MPIYEYEHDIDPAGGCSARFEAFQKIADEPLANCPACGKACHRVLSVFGVAASGSAGILSKSNLEAHGFTQYSKKGKGYYEKTAGVGPGAIAEG